MRTLQSSDWLKHGISVLWDIFMFENLILFISNNLNIFKSSCKIETEKTFFLENVFVVFVFKSYKMKYPKTTFFIDIFHISIESFVEINIIP